MSDTETPETAANKGKLLQRIGLWMLLFSGVLFTLLCLSWLFLIPRFTWFTAADTRMSPKEMASYERQLLAQLKTMEETRIRLVLPITHRGYAVLKEQKRAAPAIGFVRSQLLVAAARTSHADGIIFQSIVLDIPSRRVTVSGDVQNVGLSSMTVLAGFVEELGKLSIMSSLEPPAYARLDTPGIGPHSPFTFSFVLKKQEQ